MAARFLFASVLFGALAMAGGMIVPETGRAQDDGYSDDYSFEDFMAEIEEDKKDQERCRNTVGDISAQEQVDACTRLIENAPYENDLVGEYYVDRATGQTDPAAQCADVRKVIQVLEDSNSTIYGESFLSAARSLEAAACR